MMRFASGTSGRRMRARRTTTFFGATTPREGWSRLASSPDVRRLRATPLFCLALLTSLLAVSTPHVRPLALERPTDDATASVDAARPRASGKPGRTAGITKNIRGPSGTAVGYATYYARIF